MKRFLIILGLALIASRFGSAGTGSLRSRRRRSYPAIDPDVFDPVRRANAERVDLN